jgi:diadenosine tetraphosphate (Ap4A) HIT family hydrolase
MSTSRTDPDQSDGCVICEFVSQRSSGGRVYEDAHWVAGVLPGLELPGWIVLAVRRHTTDAAALRHDAAESLGPVIVRLSRAIRDAVGAERVYVLAYGENAPHWHVLLAGRGAHVPPEHRHAAFWIHREQYVDPAAAQAAAARIRDGLLVTHDAG